MRTVPRHLFVPDAAPSEAYAEQAVITKRAPDGAALSCASAPEVVAMLLEQLILSGVEIGPYDPFDGIWLRLTATEPGCCRIAATPEAVGSMLCAPAIAQRSPALAEEDSLADLSLARNHAGPGRHVLSATGHGPGRHDLTDRLITAIHTWDGDRTAIPVVTAYRGLTGAPHHQPSELILKPDSPLKIAF
ncbi:hypothetical protein Franean1_3517 [Parafrankia sp. EAN1pec]|uniref:hypothetical protein n=1 Tax=Parafrankia sp. (strain EAN1pec) TaxID=298653 RepID=UPI0000544B6F|nr:hypothetical protein Franean1_3517 [Frankia sp. EAN1pec]